MALPASYEPNHFAKVLFFGAFIQSFAYSSLVVLVLRNSVKLKRVVFTFLFILFLLETFLYFRFNSRFDPNVLTLILQTNLDEMKEFVYVYLISPCTLIFFISGLLFYVLIYYSLGKTTQINYIKRWFVAVALCVALVLGGIVSFASLPFNMGQNTINRLYTSVEFVKERHDEIDKMVELIDDISIYKSPNKEGAPTIILVIGESFNKHHSSLYGYHLQTSPNMQKEIDKGNLQVFSNAISPTSGTSFAMRFLFTLRGCERSDSTSLSSYVLMPIVFKQAGYNVAYFDNQYTRSSGGTFDYSCGYFLNPSIINNSCFDFRNTDIYEYDGDFVNRHSDNILKSSKSLNIIHLKGQHFDAALRFPESFKHFTADDIKRQDLNVTERQRVADYDNATLYNDYVLGEIINLLRDKNAIMIYLSDHGEHIYDTENHYYGRGIGGVSEEENLKAVYQVPMMVWCSDSFIENNDSIFQSIKNSTSHKLCTADVPYLLFDLAGIDFNYNEIKRSVINEEYKPHDVEFIYF